MAELENAVRQEAANVAADVATVINGGVAADVIQTNNNVLDVAQTLEDHAETSEERHEEILEGEAWLRKQMESLSMTMSSQMTVLQAIQAGQLTIQSRLMELAPIPVAVVTSPDSPPSIPATEEIPVVAPEADAVAVQEVPKTKRPVRVKI